MPIDNLPLNLQETIQQNMLERAYYDGLVSETAYREIASKETFPVRIGETLTKTRKSRLAPNIIPLDPTKNGDIDNGMTAYMPAVEQFTVGINQYGDYTPLNLLDNQVNIVNNFLTDAENLGIQASQSRERLARNAIFSAYTSGNTWITATLAVPGDTIAVDDVRGFDKVYDSVTGIMQPISITYPLPCYLDDGDGTNLTTLNAIAVAPDMVNTSSLAAYGGKSGTIQFSANATVAQGTIYKSIRHYYAPIIIRPNNKTNFMQLATTDSLTFDQLVHGVNMLRNNRIPMVDGNFYNLYMDYSAQNQLLKSDQFKYLTATTLETSTTVKQALFDKVLGSIYRFTTETIQQQVTNFNGDTVNVNRIIIGGGNSLIEAEFEGTQIAVQNQYAQYIHHIEMHEGIAFIVRGALDMLGMNLTQAWTWIGGYVAPTDILTTPEIIPTSNGKYFKRAVIIESAS
jgi:hypothetical protein